MHACIVLDACRHLPDCASLDCSIRSPWLPSSVGLQLLLASFGWSSVRSGVSCVLPGLGSGWRRPGSVWPGPSSAWLHVVGARDCLARGTQGGGGWGVEGKKKVCVPKMGLSFLTLYSKFHFPVRKIFLVFGSGGGGLVRGGGRFRQITPLPPCGYVTLSFKLHIRLALFFCFEILGGFCVDKIGAFRPFPL